MKKLFTIILLRPEYVADDSVPADTYTGVMAGDDAAEAIKKLQISVCDIDGYDEADPDDYYPIAVFSGDIPMVYCNFDGRFEKVTVSERPQPALSETIRKVLQFAYCLDYDKFCSIMGRDEDYYSKEKWELMQKDFSKWFCYLDSRNAERFISAAVPGITTILEATNDEDADDTCS